MTSSPSTFLGYGRPDGTVGVRNHVAVVSVMDNCNPVTRRVAAAVYGTIPVTTLFVRGQLGRDLDITLDTLAGLARNPNVAAVLLIGLEAAMTEALAKRIRPCGKTVAAVVIQEVGGTINAVVEGSVLLLSLDQHQLYLVLGGLLLAFSLVGFVPVPEGRHVIDERLWNPFAGFWTGFVGGLSSFPGPPLVLYFMWLRVEKDVFVGTSAAIYFMSGVPLMATLVLHGALGWREALVSVLALVPLLAFMRLGRAMRGRLSQRAFSAVTLIAVAAISLELLRRGLTP